MVYYSCPNDHFDAFEFPSVYICTRSRLVRKISEFDSGFSWPKELRAQKLRPVEQLKKTKFGKQNVETKMWKPKCQRQSFNCNPWMNTIRNFNLMYTRRIGPTQLPNHSTTTLPTPTSNKSFVAADLTSTVAIKSKITVAESGASDLRLDWLRVMLIAAYQRTQRS